MPDGTDTLTPLRVPAKGTPAPRSALWLPIPDRSERARVKPDGKYFARDAKRFRARGVTYGPFEPGAEGYQFPTLERTADDFAAMRTAGVNAIRTYHVPPAWLLDLAGDHGIQVFVDVPWRKHLCFLDSSEARAEAREAVRSAAKRGCGHSSLFAYSIGNEIPTDVIRWHGARRVERFLAELADVARQTDPDGLVTYTSFPPTEYLDLSPLDFVTFNVYLHDPEAFRRYLFRLQNAVGDKPLVLGEIGMDTFRHGEEKQAEFLSSHIREARLAGVAGLFVFSWTDDWYTGGHRIEDWAFGITHADRSPKAGLHAVAEAFASPLRAFLPHTPRASVVVCTYNGGRTLDQCLRSLQNLKYPDYEVIVVDDGSTDDTREILSRYPKVKAIHQPNMGLSAARNVGLFAATGEIVAYTDSDCFADPDWLTHLVAQLQRTGAAAVGGPNLTPEDGWLAACVGASPGQPTHVLESDQVAEHVPGCNMTFRRDALLAISGFDPLYRKAGDDVDVCWRLQQSGEWITFAPGAFVWHHRRQGPRSYLRQQAGYGEAEALLRFHHPDRFNARGEGKWRGMLYGSALQGLRFGRPLVHRGVFGAGLFQCAYQPNSAHWAMLPSTLEWHAIAGVVAALGAIWLPLLFVAVGMIALSVLIAILQAAQAKLPSAHDGFLMRVVVAALCYAQPLVRSWKRYRTRFFHPCVIVPDAELVPTADQRLPLTGVRVIEYWSEKWQDRTELLNAVCAYLTRRRWAKVLDSGWEAWDLIVYCNSWAGIRVTTVQEDHGSGRRLIRARFSMRLRTSAKIAVGLGLVAAGTLGAALGVAVGVGIAGGVLAATALAWGWAARRAARAVAVFDSAAKEIGLVLCDSAKARTE
ncbi:MAG: glycosyltransferase [Planctomycetia bacterium]|nr:glycosyltransferase [Planctomycetia bacterium]